MSTQIERYAKSVPATQDGGGLAVMPQVQTMTIAQFDERQTLIKHVVAQMKPGVHMGVIPGTKDVSLWEAGAEYLRAAFNIDWGYEVIEERENPTDHDYYYRFFVFQQLGPGVRGPGWEASAHSKERKFFCHGGKDGCPKDCAQTHWPSMEAQMLPHNVRDRALKRGFVAMIRNVTGTTGWFKAALDQAPEQFDANEPMGDGTDHPLLQACPTHKIAWFKSEKMREPAHKSDDGWCNQSAVLKPILDEMLKEVASDSWTQVEVNEFLKANHGGTWSSLSPRVKLAAVTALKSTPPPSTTPTTDSGAPVDPETGAIGDPSVVEGQATMIEEPAVDQSEAH